ncbi:unnamed protein product [Rotaria socialis]|uniref:NACHT domain-containing protein n=1 Tax=Rotaria socialis TaxID=392032 RepID=A0A817U7V9_9BILA|nr:unnamed protein product [Rotaria socialis]CAF4490146.1 unnamed protein product [Rotaria socialis]
MDRSREPITIDKVLDIIRQYIEAAKHVHQYQAECEAMSERLVRLMDKLDGSSEQLRRELGNVVFDNIVLNLFRTLSRIRNSISECQHPNEALKGPKKLIAQQALKRELDNAKFALINYEADLTADLEKKKEILSVALREKRVVDKNRQNTQIDERSKLFLNMIGTEMELMKKNNLPILYENHEKIIKRYLSHCMNVHARIPIVGLEATMKDFVTNIYQLPPSEFSVEATSDIRTIELPVESVYIHLQADRSTAFEREQARKLISQNNDDNDREKDVYNREMMIGLASEPVMYSLIERERVNKEKESDKSNFREILRNNRWIVILGDPGSGKTTFVRWLLSRYIQEIEKDEQKLRSDASDQDRDDQEEDEEKNSKDETFVVGPPRMPILIRVGEFVEALQKNKDLSLIDYIGFHTWMGDSMLNFKPGQSKDDQQKQMKQLQIALHDYIKKGYALIVLDGLDEIPESETRKNVVTLVEDFVANYVQTPSSVSVFDDQFINGELDIPYKAGGNQLIITSRIVGYHKQPLSGQFSHYTILPMEMDDTKKFADHWFETVHKKMISLLELNILDEVRENVCAHQIELLKTELDKPGNKGLRHMASNPCLMNFICLIAFRTRGAELPAQRIRLYDEMATLMMKLWIAKGPHGFVAQQNVVHKILCDIALYIHQNCPSGLIERTYLKMVCLKSLQERIKATNKKEQEQLVEQCVDQFERNAGILAARGQHLYGFLHLTLQEYYTCRNIISIEKNKSWSANLAKIFQEHITDPRFRVPLTLALGWISWKKEKSELDEFCQALFTSNNHLSRYFPLEILMFITSIDELEKLPSRGIIFTGLSRLLSIAAKNNWHTNYPNLENRMAIGLLKLPREQIEAWIYQEFSSENATIESISSLCTLLKECEKIAQSEENNEKNVLLKQWANKNACKYLLKYLPDDNIDNQFLIDAVLTKIAIKGPKALPSNDLRTFFIENPKCLPQLNLPVLAAIIALYGGLTLSYEKNKKDREKTYNYDDLMVTSADFAVIFSQKCMHRSSPLTPLFIEYIRGELSGNQAGAQSTFIERIKQEARKIRPDDPSLKAVDTFILMFCIVGVDEVWLYKDFVKHRAFHLAIDRFKGISNYLRQFYFIPEIYNKYERSISSKESLLSNFDNFNEYMYKKSMTNQNSTYLIDLFMNWHQTIDKVRHQPSSVNDVKILFTFIDSICRGRARLCTSTRTYFTNKWLCKSDQRFLLLPKFFRKQENLKQLLVSTSNESSFPGLSLSMFLRTLWMFNDTRHGVDISEVIINKAECSMLFEYDRNHSFALAFVPKHLQLLFSCAMQKGHIFVQRNYENPVATGKSKYAISFAHILCTSLLSVCTSPISYACQSALVALLPLARFYRLEHLILALLYWSKINSEHDPDAVKWYFEEMKRPRDHDQFSYSDNYHKLTDVDRIELSDTEVDESLRIALEQVVRRVRDALQLLKSRNSVEKTNLEIFSASISLGYLCWASESEEKKVLFEEAIQAASKISDELVRLDALIVLASCPFLRSSEYFSSDLNQIRASLNDSTKKAFSTLPSDLTPLVSVSFVDRYVSLVGADDKIIERIDHILDQTDHLKDEADRQAVCIALGASVNLSPEISSKLFGLMQEFTVSSVLARAHVLQFDSPLLRYFAINSKEHKTNPYSFLYDRDHSQSISVLYASLYLANLSSDVQKLSTWLNSAPLLKVDISRLLDRQNGQSQEKRILTYSHINAIETKLSLLEKEQVSNEVTILCIDLYDLYHCEWSAQPFLMKWLSYKKDSPYYALACHAALILGRSNVWTVKNVHIICDLLESNNDRLRQETECLLNGNERKSSELGWDILIIFIERFISYETKSTYASLVLSWFFEKLTIDSTEHLKEIIELEQKRTRFHKNYKNNTEELTTAREKQKLFENSSPIARWFVHLTPDVLQYFLTYLQAFIGDLPARRNRDRLKLTESQLLFVFSWCAKILSVDSNGVDMILKMLSKILTGKYSSNAQYSAAFVIGHNSKQEAQEILLDVLQNTQGSDINISERVLAMCIHAYCWSRTFNKIKRSKEEKNNKDKNEDEDEDEGEDNKKGNGQEDDNEIVSLCEKMLRHSSSDVRDAASIELAKVCHDIGKLLEYFETDPERCYQSLIRVRIDKNDTKALKTHSKSVVELIKAHPDLLRIYIIDLYDTIKHFGDEIEPYPEWSTEFNDLCLIDIACDLVEEMPSAFFHEIDQMSEQENLQKALFQASKQHNIKRRNACIKLLASFGDFNPEICDLLIDVVVENPSTQEICLNAIKNFRKPRASAQKESALQQLDQILEQMEPSIKELEQPLVQLKSALLELENPQNCLKKILALLESIINQLESDQKEFKSNLTQFESTLKNLKPILKQWKFAFDHLNEYLLSPSLIQRWAAAVFFERLVQCNVVSAHRVQHLLSNAIEDPVSNSKIWLGKSDDSQSVYNCVGCLKHMLYKLLMRMSSVDETLAETNVVQTRNRLLEDFDVSEINANLSSCVNIDEDPLDSDYETDESDHIDRQKINIILPRPNSSQVPIEKPEDSTGPSRVRPSSARVTASPVPSNNPANNSKVCSMM